MLKRLRKNHPLLYCIGAEAVFLGSLFVTSYLVVIALLLFRFNFPYADDYLLGSIQELVGIVVGVVLGMPVELSGRLETADRRPLPDAVVALTQDGALVAQTTTNAEGAFGFKVRRGTYELTFFTPDESGQPVQTTVKVKAPLSGVTLTAERPCSGAV